VNWLRDEHPLKVIGGTLFGVCLPSYKREWLSSPSDFFLLFCLIVSLVCLLSWYETLPSEYNGICGSIERYDVSRTLGQTAV